MIIKVNNHRILLLGNSQLVTETINGSLIKFILISAINFQFALFRSLSAQELSVFCRLILSSDLSVFSKSKLFFFSSARKEKKLIKVGLFHVSCLVELLAGDHLAEKLVSCIKYFLLTAFVSRLTVSELGFLIEICLY